MQYRLRESWRRQTSRINPQPIFVFGNQKSGTSAVAGLLGEATGLSYTIDIFCLYRGLEERLLSNEASFDELLSKARYYFSQDIIKDPSFTLFYDDFRDKFPDSRRVFVLRDPRQNIRSILNRLGLPGNLKDLSTQHWSRLKEEYPDWYIIVEGSLAGHKGNNYIENLALRCRKFFQIYLKYQTEVIPVRYEDFNQDKVETIQNLAAELGLKIIQNIDRVKDVQFQPKGNPTVDLDAFFGAENLKIIQNICGEEMTAVGYQI